jgi:2'-5' RNA ligase
MTRTDPPQSLRLFYALWPDDATRSALQALQMQMHLAGRNTSYANLHLTLAFLGEQPAASLPTLKKVLTQLPRVPIELTIDRMAYFNKSRIAWAGSHAVPPALFDLQAALGKALVESGIDFDQRAFKPHITLARNAAAPEDRAFNSIDWQANEVALVHSLQVEGVLTYRVLAAQRLDSDSSYS